jgi:hypothetical protein
VAAAGGGEVVFPVGTFILNTGITVSHDYVSFRGAGRGTILKKGADVTLIDVSGTSDTRRYGCHVFDMQLGGGNNVLWTAPLYKSNYTSKCFLNRVLFFENYGPVLTSRQGWDNHYTECNFWNCGAGDSSAPMVRLYSEAGDAGNATNNTWFVNCVFEAWRTGAVWIDGATSSDPVILVKFVNSKFERVGTAGSWGPALKMVYSVHFDAVNTHITVNGTPDPAQTTPYDSHVYIKGSKHVAFENTLLSVGNPGVGNITSLVHCDGASAANSVIKLGTMKLASGSGSSSNKPAAVIKFDGTNDSVKLPDLAWDSNYWNVRALARWSRSDPVSLGSVLVVVEMSSLGIPSARLANHREVDE